jgi:hypothetical protein
MTSADDITQVFQATSIPGKLSDYTFTDFNGYTKSSISKLIDNSPPKKYIISKAG